MEGHVKIMATHAGHVRRQLARKMTGRVHAASQIHADFPLAQGGKRRIVWKGDDHAFKLKAYPLAGKPRFQACGDPDRNLGLRMKIMDRPSRLLAEFRTVLAF